MTSPNPYRTAPGSVPPELAGRDKELGAASYATAMTRTGAPAKPIVFTGLRGMGKTALLRRCITEAQAAGGVSIVAEAEKSLRFANVMRRELTAALTNSDSLPKRLGSALRTILEGLPKISYELPHDGGGIAFSANDEPADELVRQDSLEDVLLALNEQLHHHERFLVIGLDEIQESASGDLVRIVRAVHATAGTDRPILLFAAGLPNSASILKAARTYTERYAYLRLELLSRAATIEAVDVPARKLGAKWTPEAADAVYAHSSGYPYFVQEFASAAWIRHTGDTIEKADVDGTSLGVQTMLDESLYNRQFAQISPREAAYILALHQLGAGTHYSEEIANALNTTSSELGSTRSALIKKDVLFVPARGLTEFRLPLTTAYIDRHLDALVARASLAQRRSKQE